MIVKLFPLLLVILNCYHAMAVCTTSSCVQQTSQIGSACTSQLCVQNLPCQTNSCDYKTSCDDNMILYFGKCLTLDIAQCPFNTVLRKGYCIAETVNCTGESCKDDKPKIICPEGSYLKENRCYLNHTVECPSGYKKINETCVHDGSCPTGTFKYNEQCYSPCPENSKFVNGTCIITINSTSHTTVPHTVINNYTNIVNLTNILNHTNIFNIITNTSEKNENNIKLKSDSHANNGQGSKSKKSMKTNCCHITEPTTCKEIEGKKVCYNKKKQVCGKECDGREEEDYMEIEDKEELVQPRPQPYIVTVQNQSTVPPIPIFRPPLVKLPIIIQEPPIQRPRQIIIQEPPIQRPRQIIIQELPIQRPRILVQEAQIQRPQILMQPQIQRPQIIVQQLQTQRPQIVIQQPQILRPQIVQQPQIISQPVVVQQPQVISQPAIVQQPQIIYQQPQIVQQPQMIYQQPQIVQQPQMIYQQPQIVQQPQMTQYAVQQPQASQMVSGTGSCAYQNNWPFVKCL